MEHIADPTLSPREALQALTADPELERLESLLAEFSLFDVLGVTHLELQHSRVIAWLLDPRESHGLGDHFLRNFLSKSATLAIEREIKCVAFTPADVDGWKFTNVEIARERHNIDILLIDGSNELVCPIENKIGSDEHSDQLSRYLGTVEREYKGLTPFPIYLTPDGRKPEKRQDVERWIPFGYEVVAILLKQTLNRRGSTISADVSSFLKQYERTLRRRVLDTPSDIDRLALQIYNDHRQAIDLIVNAKSFPKDIVSSAIQSAKSRYASDDLIPEHSDKTTIRFFSMTLEGIHDLQKGESFQNSERLGLFEILIREERATLVFMVGKGPQKIRKRLYEFAQNSKWPLDVGGMKERMERGRHFSIYRKSILDKQDFNPFNPDEARPKIENAIKEFFDNDYLPLVNAIRKEFNRPPVSPN